MSIDLMRPEVDELRPRISVIGVGGAGGNAIANMMNADVQGVEFLVANTDAQALNASDADTRIQLGMKITQGLGAGSRPEIGRAAAEETMEEIEKTLEGSHMCFIAAGMGGGTGTGAAPVIAKAARDKGILTVGVVTKPFAFEGARRMRSAESGLEELQKHVDTLIVIPNQNLFRLATADTTFKEAFEMADEVLQQGVRGITDLMVMPGLINLDFADVRSVMGEMGKAMMGTGEAEGDNRAIEAAEKAISNPLLDGVSMKGAKGVIISITGGMDMKLMEVDEAASHIKELVDDDANIIWGSAFNDDLDGKIRVSVVATGIDGQAAAMPTGATTATATTTGGSMSGSMGAGKVFAFPGKAMGGAETPTTPTTEADTDMDDEDEALDLTQEAADDEDELLLGQEDAVTTPPIATPEANDEDDNVPNAGFSGVKGEVESGTLFERMSSIARGAATAEAKDGEEARDAIDIPRFLNRQNNQ
ncbi:cell division protein FtsZ [Sphingomicrobium clamense]|uniref:Cell division protein FtsZ n=1 Tax=Sphingomicrobium clamense TaxID=2851013 RepID=A0ABS6V4B8_9SPHN|nr:cell division protein FtsZ [Sphingomicrobium sp. B8]MBW0144407.1 cell division protein FtsZ [Sphingomicrobium sp. B8]